MLADMWNLIA